MSQIIDARGKACPTPVLMAKGAMAQGAEAFTILVDNTTAVENLKRLAIRALPLLSGKKRAGPLPWTLLRARAASPVRRR